jgi:hypothetical protein
MLRNGSIREANVGHRFSGSGCMCLLVSCCAIQFPRGPSLINHELNLAHRPDSEVLGYHLSRLAFRSEAFRLEPLRMNDLQENCIDG